MLTYALLRSGSLQIVGVLHHRDRERLGWVPWVLEHFGISHSPAYGRYLDASEFRAAVARGIMSGEFLSAELTDFATQGAEGFSLEVGEVTPLGYVQRFVLPDMERIAAA